MNAFLLVFAAFYFLEQIVDFGLNWLNLKHSQEHEKEVPAYFREKITPEHYQKSIAYNREKTFLGIISGWIEVPVFWGLLLGGFFGKVDSWVRSFQVGSISTGLFFFFLMMTLSFVIALPFSLYGTFIIEQKYGFNRMGWRTWAIDLVKGIFLSVLIGAPVLAGVLWFMDHFLKQAWWIWVWGLLVIVQIVIQAIFPVVIVPLFNRLTPLPEGSLRDQIVALAKKTNFRLSGIFTMDGSKRSTHSNAFFAGVGKFRRIILFDTLVALLKEKELLSVLAHEIGHSAKKHIRTTLVLSGLTSLVGLFILSKMLPQPWFCSAFKFDRSSSYAALFVFVKTAGPFAFFLSPLSSWLSRKHEYEADRFAVQAIEDRQPMIQSLIKLTADNLSNLTPHPLYSFFYYSHPTVMERIVALEEVKPNELRDSS
jgi:STE24 endopeptidase